MAVNNSSPITLEDTNIILRNFEGRASEYNQAGNRNFGVLLTPEQAERAEADGWRVRYLKPREEDLDPQPWIKVTVAFRKRTGERVQFPPRIVMITGKGKSTVDEHTVKILDWVDVDKVDLTIRPFANQDGLANGYLKTLYVNVREDEFERKYYDLPDADGYDAVEEYGSDDDE